MYAGKSDDTNKFDILRLIINSKQMLILYLSSKETKSLKSRFNIIYFSFYIYTILINLRNHKSFHHFSHSFQKIRLIISPRTNYRTIQSCKLPIYINYHISHRCNENMKTRIKAQREALSLSNDN